MTPHPAVRFEVPCTVRAPFCVRFRAITQPEAAFTRPATARERTVAEFLLIMRRKNVGTSWLMMTSTNRESPALAPAAGGLFTVIVAFLSVKPFKPASFLAAETTR